MADLIRLALLIFYAIGVGVFLFKVLPSSSRTALVEHRASGPSRYLPALLVPLDWVLPPTLIFLRIGEISAEWPVVRVLGLLLTAYAAVMLLWAPQVLGRFLVSPAVVLEDHELVTRGPYQYVRHPAYSGDLALFLGAALATLNGVLLLLWPVALLGVLAQIRRRSAFLHQSSEIRSLSMLSEQVASSLACAVMVRRAGRPTSNKPLKLPNAGFDCRAQLCMTRIALASRAAAA